MSRYATDPRVQPFAGRCFAVTRDGTEYHVLPTEVFGWVICAGPNLDFVPSTDGGFAIGFADADHAIDALLDASADAPEIEASNSGTPGHAATSAAADDETYAGGVDFRERPSPAVRRELAYVEDLAAELPAATDTDDDTDGM